MSGGANCCPWCGAPFEARTSGGRAQRFCRPEHRRLWDTATRTFVAQEIAAGRLTVDKIRAALPEKDNARVAETNAGVGSGDGGYPTSPDERPAPSGNAVAGR